MKPWKRKPNKLEKLRATGLIEDAMGRVQEPRSEDDRPFADRCLHVRTATARKAHLLPPEGNTVLCGWPGATFDADPSLAVCHMCAGEAQRRDGVLAS